MYSVHLQVFIYVANKLSVVWTCFRWEESFCWRLVTWCTSHTVSAAATVAPHFRHV